MAKLLAFVVMFSLCFLPLIHGGRKIPTRTQDGSEEWGYVEVRPKAHMFWWLYKSPYRVEDPSKPWPIVLWLQGGPKGYESVSLFFLRKQKGASGVGIGNFEEVGPLDTGLKPRNLTWLQKADLLFVDNPVGTGYSFVEDTKLFVKSDLEAADDLTTLLEKLFNGDEKLQKSPLFIVAQSYGGKFAFSWGPLLKDVSRLDDNGLKQAQSLAEKIRQQIQQGQYEEATDSWGELEDVIYANSNGVDFYNFLLDSEMDSVSSSTTVLKLSKESVTKRYSRYLSVLRSTPTPGGDDDLDDLMNGAIKKKLKIIPENVTWGGQSKGVFLAMQGDFMRPRIDEVDQLLAKGVNVTIYSGQLDLICATKGTEAWVKKLKWEGLQIFLSKDRTPLYCGKGGPTKGFMSSHQNLHFYWILGAGHDVPADQPCVALDMLGHITNSPR
ncbi:hypothetical protein F8388_020598 [Cannabis sativa]|uniref:Serine carboxypeptidase-like 51 n=1 Tax=Cannabis sativa TaxID=3483 RepID=A0A7J6EPD3_CANSA|nr:hypothetical protein F8388_020598 [Cannabis sativa]